MKELIEDYLEKKFGKDVKLIEYFDYKGNTSRAVTYQEVFGDGDNKVIDIYLCDLIGFMYNGTVR